MLIKFFENINVWRLIKKRMETDIMDRIIKMTFWVRIPKLTPSQGYI